MSACASVCESACVSYVLRVSSQRKGWGGIRHQEDQAHEESRERPRTCGQTKPRQDDELCPRETLLPQWGLLGRNTQVVTSAETTRPRNTCNLGCRS